MKAPISTRTHAILDYVTVGTFLTLPRALNWSDRLTGALTTLALGKLAYTLLTRHEGGALKVLPMKAHLTLDAIGGATIAALPWALEEDDDIAKATCAALGAFDILAAPMTQTQAPEEHLWEQRPAAPEPAVPQSARQSPPPVPTPA